jgi:hypothetical protein
MRGTDIIRQILNMIDSIETNAAQGEPHELNTNVPTIEIVGVASEPEITIEPEVEVPMTIDDPDELERMKQIAGLVSPMDAQYTTAPNERIAGIEAVTTNAGGGVNGPKDPADIRSSTVAMYPGKVYGAK